MAEEWIGNWKKKNKKTKYSNPWIDVEHHEIVNPNGGDGIYGVVRFKNLAIGVIPLDEDLNTWLVGQHRYPQNKYSWEIIEGGGPIEIDPLLSAQRELQEEVGLEAKNYEMFLEMDLSNSVSDEVAYIYCATGLTQVELNPDETEDLAVKKFDKYRIEYLNSSATEEEFDKRYLELQAKANLSSYKDFLI